MTRIGDFDNFVQIEAICTYLRSFGYKAYVDQNTLTAYVQDPVLDSFVVLAIPTWEVAREFIKVRAEVEI
jgi:hypothetical protein